ncbi:B12-binding domain-containing radical SAM protein [candidate division WOR-3 bacterium]|nr:B12-binding domain-containing radical SAM protein [candidate division WOR-3 bacterium]
MKIGFFYISPPPDSSLYTGMNQGVAILVSILKNMGYKPDFRIIYGRDDIISINTAYDLALISSFSGMIDIAEELAIHIKRISENTYVVLGGVHATVAPYDAIKLKGVDAVVVGEGETAIREIIRNFERKDFGNVPGMLVEKGNSFPAPTFANLNTLPFPDRSIFDQKGILSKYGKIVGAEFMLGRGCPYSCTYCINAHLNKLYDRKHIRLKSPEYAIEEIKNFIAEYGKPALIGFHDDIFPFESEWLEKFSHIYKREIDIPFWANTRVGIVNKKLLRIYKETGCIRLHIGVETANERLRKQVLHRDMTNDQIIDTFKLIKDYGIKTLAFNMFGIPYETEDTIIETINLLRKIKPFRTIISLFTPFPGTELYDICKREGWKFDYHVRNFYEAKPPLTQPSISNEKLIYYFTNAIRMIYE